MDAHEHVLRAVDLALDERDVVLAGQRLAEGDRRELAVGGRQRARDVVALDELLVAAPVLDQVGDRDHLQPVPRAVLDRSGTRAIVPSSLHDLADDAGRVQAGEPREVDGGLGLARRAASTPPGRARSGKTWPGWTRSCGLEAGSIATWIVCARSCAEMPVVTPSRASIETVKAVPNGVSLLVGHLAQAELVAALLGQAEADRARAPCVAMKLIASGVANCAAIVRSPSFSRSASSTTTTKLPCADVLDRLLDGGERARCSCQRSSLDRLASLGDAASEPLDVLGEHVDLEVDLVARARARRASSPRACAGRARPRSRRRRARRPSARRRRRRSSPSRRSSGGARRARRSQTRTPSPSGSTERTRPTPSTWPWTIVAAERLAGPQRRLDVDRVAAPSAPSVVRASVSGTASKASVAVADLDDGQADAVDRDRVAEPRRRRRVAAPRPSSRDAARRRRSTRRRRGRPRGRCPVNTCSRLRRDVPGLAEVARSSEDVLADAAPLRRCDVSCERLARSSRERRARPVAARASARRRGAACRRGPRSRNARRERRPALEQQRLDALGREHARARPRAGRCAARAPSPPGAGRGRTRAAAAAAARRRRARRAAGRRRAPCPSRPRPRPTRRAARARAGATPRPMTQRRAGHGDAAVERDRDLVGHERAPERHPGAPGLVLARAPRSGRRSSTSTPGLAQPLEPAAGLRVRVERAGDDARDSRLERPRRRTAASAVVRARLERHVERRAARALAGRLERDDLGVAARPRSCQPSPTTSPSGDDDRADDRVRIASSRAPRSASSSARSRGSRAALVRAAR